MTLPSYASIIRTLLRIRDSSCFTLLKWELARCPCEISFIDQLLEIGTFTICRRWHIQSLPSSLSKWWGDHTIWWSSRNALPPVQERRCRCLRKKILFRAKQICSWFFDFLPRIYYMIVSQIANSDAFLCNGKNNISQVWFCATAQTLRLPGSALSAYVLFGHWPLGL